MIRIAGGRVHDPAGGIDGEVRDVGIGDDGRIVDAADVPASARTIDARGMVVMPGGVDVHAHIAGPTVNAARRLLPERSRPHPHQRTEILRSGLGGTVPSTHVTGYRYSLLGYTTVVEAAAQPLSARHVLAELRDTPLIDPAVLVLLGDNAVLADVLREDAAAARRSDGPTDGTPGVGSERLREAMAWWLRASGAHGVKLVAPGGATQWKRGGGTVGSIDALVPALGLSPRTLLEGLVTAGHELGLPHPVHVHCNDLGVGGNVETTLATMRAVAGRRTHFAHLQFHAYGGEPTAKGGTRMTSAATRLLEHLDAHPEHSIDVGQIMFGEATTMTAEPQISATLAGIEGAKWLSADTEHEGGCGIVPYAYEAANEVHALQWAIGLELFLLSRDPWQVSLSTDHPNGGSFLSYPRLIRLLMDRGFRNAQVRAANRRAMRRTALIDDPEREYTLNEIAIVTRAGPARQLGLHHKGHLGIGADADVTIYHHRPDDYEAMFATPRYVLKGGTVVVDDGDLVATPAGTLQRVGLDVDAAIAEELRPRIEDRYSVPFDHYAVTEPHLLEPARETRAVRP